MAGSVLAAQLFTLRDSLKTPKDIAETMKKVKAIGYDAVQLSGLGPIDPKELAGILSGEGLEAAATHTGFEEMRDKPDEVMDRHRLWGCRHIAIGGMPSEYRSADGFSRFAREFSDVAGPFVEAGFTTSYHNHSFELERVGDKTGLDILMDESDPERLFFEIDTYWIQHGGGDPVLWIRKVAGRIPLVHFKDMAVAEGKQVMAEVGEGNLNWPAIIDACGDAGVEWYLVEQDTCRRDPFESLAISLGNLKSMGLS